MSSLKCIYKVSLTLERLSECTEVRRNTLRLSCPIDKAERMTLDLLVDNLLMSVKLAID